ncbi:hypothetical protein [Actinomadura monticuli]|uniref:Oxidoreductase FAD/NAD(P)-binding domain-containing protein n=1 Tax=Actinomadura monticuli TaxID=3097367 RepID=A0ABV4Q8K3_9ACTN
MPAVSDEPGGHGFSPPLGSGGGDVEYGDLPSVVAAHGPWDGHDAYVCGPSAMVGHTVEQLARLGVARDRIRLETFADAQR